MSFVPNFVVSFVVNFIVNIKDLGTRVQGSAFALRATADNSGFSKRGILSPPQPNPAPTTQHLLRALALCLLAALAASGCRRPAPPPAAAEPYSVAVELSTNRIRVGDVFRARVSAVVPPGGRVMLPELARGEELVPRARTDRTDPRQPERQVTEFTLTSFEPGQHVLSSNDVVFIDAKTNETRRHFPIAAFEVISSLAASNMPPREIKELAVWPARTPAWVWALLIAAVLVGLAAAAAYALLRRRRQAALYQPPPPLPHEVALLALQMLREKGWIEIENVRPFYWELTDIIRYYIENRFQLHAPERTTDEFIREASESRLLSPDHQHRVRAFLEQADLVKFARHRPGRPDMENAFATAERLVRETQPPPAAAAAAANG